MRPISSSDRVDTSRVPGEVGQVKGEIIKFFTHLKLCLVVAIHNFKR